MEKTLTESEKIERLMRPRYKLIADYPSCSFEVGTILEPNDEGELYSKVGGYSWTAVRILEKDVKKFPHLVKRLEWWEERTPEEMPEYVKNSNGATYKAMWAESEISENGKQQMRMRLGIEERLAKDDYEVTQYIMDSFEPATEQEYLTSRPTGE